MGARLLVGEVIQTKGYTSAQVPIGYALANSGFESVMSLRRWRSNTSSLY